jgi:hypothetical protein
MLLTIGYFIIILLPIVGYSMLSTIGYYWLFWYYFKLLYFRIKQSKITFYKMIFNNLKYSLGLVKYFNLN